MDGAYGAINTRLSNKYNLRSMIDKKKEEHLYHYTSFEAAIKIVASKELLFSKMDALNDINEQSGPEIIGGKSESGLIKKVLKGYTQISLTMDYLHGRDGYDIPAMWGHYAQKGKGFCLVFQKEELLKAVKRRNTTLYSKEVDYFDTLNPQDFLYEQRYGTLESFINGKKDTLFFHKSKDWEYEQEYRVISTKKNPKPLNVRESLVGIIQYGRTQDEFLNSIEYKVLSKIDNILEFYRYSTLLDKGTLYNIDGEVNHPIDYNIAITKNASAVE